MPYDLTQKGTTLVINEVNSGSFNSFDDLKQEILNRDKSLLIEHLKVIIEGTEIEIINGLEMLKQGMLFDKLISHENLNITQDELGNLVEAKNEGIREKAFEITKTINAARESGNWNDLPFNVKESAINQVIITNSMYVPNREIIETVDLISYECAYGMNFFLDLFTQIRDIVGGRSRTVEKTLKNARLTAVQGLKEEALFKGADAVISVQLDYLELSGGNKNGMLAVIASGTAVKLASHL